MDFRSRILHYFLFLLLSLSASTGLSAQSENIFRNYYLNQVIINPATSGSEYYSIVNLSFSRQWLGFKNSPSLQMLSTSLRMGNYDFYNPKQFLNKTGFKSNERIGFGAVVYNANEGPFPPEG
ncbi:MAG TPA: type IX secretion system membrane protein PorP/SprF [Bacteroidales bacterium]|nr:type IX secretion system membrane protein PorP/SprF [Bacteroidales bacterium]